MSVFPIECHMTSKSIHFPHPKAPEFVVVSSNRVSTSEKEILLGWIFLIAGNSMLGEIYQCSWIHISYILEGDIHDLSLCKMKKERILIYNNLDERIFTNQDVGICEFWGFFGNVFFNTVDLRLVTQLFISKSRLCTFYCKQIFLLLKLV